MAATTATAIGLASFNIFQPIILGIVWAIVEDFFLFEDESLGGATRVLTNALWVFPKAIALTAIAMNQSAIMNAFKDVPAVANLVGNYWTFKIGIFLLTVIFIAGHRLIKMSMGMGSASGFAEKFPHKLIVGALVAFSPEVWLIIQSVGIIPESLYMQ